MVSNIFSPRTLGKCYQFDEHIFFKWVETQPRNQLRSDPNNLAVLIPNYVNSQSNCLLDEEFVNHAEHLGGLVLKRSSLGAPKQLWLLLYTLGSTNKAMAGKWTRIDWRCQRVVFVGILVRFSATDSEAGDIKKAYRRNPTKLDAFFGRATTKRRGQVLLKFWWKCWMGWRMVWCVLMFKYFFGKQRIILYNSKYLENQWLLISINFTPTTSHSCLKKLYTRFSRYM